MTQKAQEILGVLIALLGIGLAFFVGTIWVRVIFIGVCLVAFIAQRARR